MVVVVVVGVDDVVVLLEDVVVVGVDDVVVLLDAFVVVVVVGAVVTTGVDVVVVVVVEVVAAVTSNASTQTQVPAELTFFVPAASIARV